MECRSLGWKTSFEIELVAPVGMSRADLACETALRLGGTVHRIFYPQAEPSLVPGVPVFETITQGFAVRDRIGNILARFVDDFTLRDDLDSEAPASDGWYRIGTDDIRLARLIARHSDPDAPLGTVLDPARQLFDGTISVQDGGMRRLDDSGGKPVALAAPLAGQRERACEIIAAPIEIGHVARLEALLFPAQELGFAAPREGAVHVHFDAGPLCDARILQRLMLLLETHRDDLRAACKTNPACRRLGPDTAEVLDVATADGFAELPWSEAAARLRAAKPTKFCDFNIRNLVQRPPDKHTVEMRILGPGLDAGEIVARARLFETLFRFAASRAPLAEAIGLHLSP